MRVTIRSLICIVLSCDALIDVSRSYAVIESDRPPPDDRQFVSPIVDATIANISSRMRDPLLARIFSNCLPNSLDTTILSSNQENPSTFVITGDIHAMWLRDSTNQVLPYLRFANHDLKLRKMLCGVIQQQAEQVLEDPYSNAFNQFPSGGGHRHDVRYPPLKHIVFEGKYELDSLASVLKLASSYYAATKDHTCFLLNDKRVLRAVEIILKTIIAEQESSADNVSVASYIFQRKTEVATDTLMLQGRGAPGKKCGLSKSYFRPSDDSNTFPFSIPSNAFASVELHRIALTLKAVYPGDDLAAGLSLKSSNLAEELSDAIMEHGVQDGHFVYEIDGLGNSIFMDDANVPSLLSFPYIGFTSTNNSLYRATRAKVLSSANAYYFSGREGSGVGGPHVGMDQIWPMAIIIQALTSVDDKEITECLEILRNTTADTYFMHESFDCENAKSFTRPWFAWANSMFGELILMLAEHRPHLIFVAPIGDDDYLIRSPIQPLE
uniref:Glycoside hydrolase family 125 protein n=1 Tax=Spongospora subterranea TaxID=70186 RepID=A0A0H5R0Z9_9EUKA|eukprot:CRZ01469.1 hypothetical protein [Spongospora subterranea]